MALERATLQWGEDTFYFLSPDGEDWLEVTAESFHRSVDHEADTVAQLRKQLAGENGTMRLRYARRYLSIMNTEPDKTVVFS